MNTDFYQSIKLVLPPNTSEALAAGALRTAHAFIRDYPDRVGFRRGCVYAFEKWSTYVYRTKGGMVVVRLNQ